MKFYVAARWEDFEIAQKVCDDLEKRGHICTHNWMKIAKAVETEDLVEDFSVSAPDDLHGVQEADMLLLIACGTGGQGRWVEMGVALDRLLPIKAWCDQYTKIGVFFHLPNVQLVYTYEDLIRSATEVPHV